MSRHNSCSAPLQLDAPQEPDAFVHRCGRTARMGRKGSALAFLLPQETSYVDFLRLRRVRLCGFEPSPLWT
jgi:ATP-dependent RNA helicase DDX55/SPB4